jgi:PIN domain nuclease of toxin-antitoxin system
MVILDTCAIIEIMKPSPSFSEKTLQLMDAGAYIMSISFAEIACKIKLGKLEMSISTRELFREFSQIESIEIIDMGVNEWLDSIELVWNDNRDPADRVITAFAVKNELSIVTTDNKIEKFYGKVIW